MRKRYRLTHQVQIDLTQIIEHIPSGSPRNALKVFDKLHEAMNRLAELPGIGHRREDITSRRVLFWPVYSYLIVYDPGDRPIKIVHIVHGARNLQAILGG
jgi:antitoxin ParD1/3/4/toxin ParE1/3/4